MAMVSTRRSSALNESWERGGGGVGVGGDVVCGVWWCVWECVVCGGGVGVRGGVCVVGGGGVGRCCL